MKTLLLIVASCLLLAASPVFGQKIAAIDPKTAAELKSLYIRFLDATRERRGSELEKIMADDYSQVIEPGRVRTKEVRIRETMEDKHRDEVLELVEFTPRLYGSTAVAICRVRNRHVEEDGKVYNVELLSTAVFVRSGNIWRIASTHVTVVDPK